MSTPPASNADRVYLFKNVELKTVSGASPRDWCVSSIEIHLRENAIPEILLTIDPVHTPADSMTQATRTTLTDLASWNALIQTTAQNKDRANLHFEIWIKDEKEQEIDLQNWIVTGGGLMTQGNHFMLQMIIQHPLALCSLVSVSLGELAEFQDVHESQGIGTNIIAALVNETRNLAKSPVRKTAVSNDNTISADVQLTVERAQERLAVAAEVLMNNLEWDTLLYNDGSQPWNYENWPQKTQLQESDLAYASVLGRYLWGVKDVNLWEILAHTVVDDWSVSIIPTFWTTLKLTPTSPWLAPMVIIDESDIASVNFSAYERSMVAGVYMLSQFPCSGLDYSNIQDPAFAMKFTTQAVLYTPKYPDLDGLVLNMNQPQWLQALGMTGVTESQARDNFGTNEEEGRVHMASNVVYAQNIDNTDPNAFAAAATWTAGAAYACANQLFLTQFRSGSQASIHTRLLLTYGGSTAMDGFVIPGYVCRVNANGIGIMDFYMTEIVHRIDFNGGVADTTISGKYVRPPQGFINIAETGTPNPMWIAKQGVTK